VLGMRSGSVTAGATCEARWSACKPKKSEEKWVGGKGSDRLERQGVETVE